MLIQTLDIQSNDRLYTWSRLHCVLMYISSYTDHGLEEALRREADTQAQCYASEDMREGLRALRERRNPIYTQSEKY